MEQSRKCSSSTVDKNINVEVSDITDGPIEVTVTSPTPAPTALNLHDIVFDENNEERKSWIICNKRFSRSLVVFFSQVLLICVLIGLCTIKIYQADRCEDLTFWIALLTLLVGYMFPNPKI